MSKEAKYWTSVLKRIFLVLIAIILTIVAFKLAIFYMPFLIAFIISLIIEPLIKKLMNKFKITRRLSSIIVFVITFGIIIGLLAWGIATIVSESSNLLSDFNNYYDNIYFQVQKLLEKFNSVKLRFSKELIDIIEKNSFTILDNISNYFQNFLMGIVNGIKLIPYMMIYVGVTILALYFICTDKIYMLDELEHHLPEKWMKELSMHIRELIKVLGGYLKAQMTLILISFIISLIGLYIMYFAGLNVGFPLIIALAIAFVDALPILGSGTVMVPWGILSGLNGDLKLGISIIVLWIIMSVTRQFIEPKVVSRKYRDSPNFYSCSNVYRL